MDNRDTAQRNTLEFNRRNLDLIDRLLRSSEGISAEYDKQMSLLDRQVSRYEEYNKALENNHSINDNERQALQRQIDRELNETLKLQNALNIAREMAEERSSVISRNAESIRQQQQQIEEVEQSGRSEAYIRQRVSTQQADIEKLKQENREIVASSTPEYKDYASGFNTNTLLGSILNRLAYEDSRRTAYEEAGIKDEYKLELKDGLKEVLKSLEGIRSSLNKNIESATNTLASVYGRLNANLEGANLTYEKISDNMEEFIGLSAIIDQTKYLSTIAELTDKGIVNNVEERALLQTIKDKTIQSFDATNASLLRLVRLFGEDFTAESFGLQVALRNVLNDVFSDSGYLGDLYYTITGAVTDALSVVGYDSSMPFLSTLQSWMAAMYESGVSQDAINKLSSAINALGSGNISALSSNAEMQKLILLSMNQATGLDYADILQRGLTAETTNVLLSSMVDYLGRIADNTKENRVLEAAYTNLFGISMADIEAFSRLNRVSEPFLLETQSKDLISYTANELAQLDASRTLFSEKVDNVISNLGFSFGKSISENELSYITYKISDAVLNLTGGLGGEGLGKSASTLVKGVNTAATIAYLLDVGLNGIKVFVDSADSVLGAISGENSVLQFFTALESTEYGEITSKTISSNQAFKTLYTNVQASTSDIISQARAEGWETEIESDITNEVLDKLQKTIMVNEEGNNYAIAVSLEGLNNEVLRSFASIFADEEAMLETFTGQNNVFSDALFKYAGNTSSNTSV